MKGHFTMSNKEVNRIAIMEKLIKKEIKQKKAAQALRLSVRQIRRLKKRYKREGATGMIHLGRGRISNRKISTEEIKRAIEIVKKEYWDFGPTFALEKLEEFHGVSFSRETLRREMIKAEIWKPKRQKRPRIHQMRKRRDQRGELVQIDGSPHAWFEDRAPKCCLLVFIDDATSELLWMEFCESETTNAYFKASFGYLKQHGKPLAFYADKHSIFRINNSKNSSSSLSDSHKLTHFGKAMEALGIELIPAHSAQAKGRVEKANGTLQDRLVKELRLRGINTIKEANKYLPEFIKKFNLKFAVRPKSLEDAHRLLMAAEKLEQILVKKYTRVLSKNLELQYKNIIYQIQTDRPTYSMRNAKVTIAEDRFGKIKIYYQGNHLKLKELKYQILMRNPRSEIINAKLLNPRVDRIKRRQQQILNPTLKPKWKPSQNHPWRQYTYAN